MHMPYAQTLPDPPGILSLPGGDLPCSHLSGWGPDSAVSDETDTEPEQTDSLGVFSGPENNTGVPAGWVFHPLLSTGNGFKPHKRGIT